MITNVKAGISRTSRSLHKCEYHKCLAQTNVGEIQVGAQMMFCLPPSTEPISSEVSSEKEKVFLQVSGDNRREKKVEQTKVLTKAEVADLVFRSGKFNPGTVAIGCLFGGDRLNCIDEAVGLEVDSEIVGLATIAPQGEMHEGQPTIVGLYVRHQFRDQGQGRKIMLATIDRMRERGLLKPYRVDATSSPGFRVCQGLPEDYRADLQINDVSMGGAVDTIMLL